MLISFYGSFFNFIIIILIIILDKQKTKIGVLKYKSKIHYMDSNGGWGERLILIISYSFIIIIAMLAIVCGLYELNSKHIEDIKTLFKYSKEIEGFILAFWATVIASITFIFTLGSKEYYLHFTRQDIAKRYGMYGVYIELVVSMVISLILIIVLMQEDESESLLFLFSIYELCILIILTLGSYALLIVGRVALSSRKFELKLLDQLFKIYGNSIPVKCNSATEDTIYVNLGYLLKRYIKLRFVAKKLNSVKRLHYGKRPDNNKWYRIAMKWIVIANIIFSLLLISEMSMEKRPLHYMVVGSIVFYITPLIIHFINKKNFVVSIMIGDVGFFLEYKDKASMFIGDISIIKNLMTNKYIKNVKNIMALYYILTYHNEEKFEKMVSDSLAEMIIYLKENEKEHMDKLSRALYYLPVFLCAYYVYDKNPKSTSLTNVYELYNSFHLSKDGNTFHDILNSFIHCASLYRLSENDKQNALNNNISSEYYTDYIGKNGYWQAILGQSK